MRPTVVAHPAWVYYGIIPVVGAAVLLGVERASGWLLDLPWVPLRFALEGFEALPDPAASLVATAIGLAGGAVIGAIGRYEDLRLRVDGKAAALTLKGKTHTIARTDTSAVFLDDDHLVILGRDSTELARLKSDLSDDRVATAFREHGFPWRDEDPYAAMFRRWVPELPELSSAEHALLKARERALAKKDPDDAEELRRELAKEGLVVRDTGKSQHWRRT
ncbi:YqeB family protein [Symbioplanes lichenis]|uniref:YqeB family protein n=1 Tax=Symbioplanes lichenis TaxID=1629072 RepID=UPI0027382B63|nr:hypothetical protein [Actinoplanes lichenis]